MNWLQSLLVRLFDIPLGFTAGELADMASHQFDLGVEFGRTQAKVHWRVIPLPFTEEQLAGASYGEFITPVGFSTAFGECNIPAPGPHGYEQRAYYVGKDALYNRTNDLLCHYPSKFASPMDSDALVPVIVTVLR